MALRSGQRREVRPPGLQPRTEPIASIVASYNSPWLVCISFVQTRIFIADFELWIRHWKARNCTSRCGALWGSWGSRQLLLTDFAHDAKRQSRTFLSSLCHSKRIFRAVEVQSKKLLLELR